MKKLFSLASAIFWVIGCSHIQIIPAEDSPAGAIVEIPFIVADDWADFCEGLTIHSVTAQKSTTGTKVYFVFSYTSDVDRGMSFFDPPAGETIQITESFMAGTDTVTIVAGVSDLHLLSNITVNFYIPAVGVGAIFLDFSAIEAAIQ